MSEENNNAKISEAEITADETKKLTEDARGLEPRRAGLITIGVVDMIVGEGGVEMPDFVATKHELEVLVRYWATTVIDLDFDYFIHTSTGRREWRTRAFALRRLGRLVQVLGKEAVDKAYSEAEETFRTRYKIGDEEWRIFTKGTEQEVREFQDRLHREMFLKKNEMEAVMAMKGRRSRTRSSARHVMELQKQEKGKQNWDWEEA